MIRDRLLAANDYDARIDAGSKLVIVERAGHELYKDQPAKTAASILAFVHANR